MAFWIAWLVSLGVAIYCVLLDIRYIRASFLVDERALFRDTVDNESFRKAVLEAQREQQAEEKAQRDSGRP